MLSARDLLVLARRTAGLSQAELGQRVGRPRSTIARWELGTMQPGYDAVMNAIAMCGLEATVELANEDASYRSDVDDRLRLQPLERLRALGTPRHVALIVQLTQLEVDAIVIGDSGAALQGWPLLLPPDGDVEVCASTAAAAHLDQLHGLRVIQQPAGTRGHRDLRRDREFVDVGVGHVQVASPLDLLRIERARHHPVQAGGVQAVLEHRRRWPKGPPPRPQRTDQQTRELLEQWLSRS